MHKIQKDLLSRLVRSNGQKYSQLTKGYSFEENIVFHLKQLLKNGFVKKQDGEYTLTKEGLRYSGRFDLDTLEDKTYKNVYIGFICHHKTSCILREHLQEDQKFYKFPGAKPFLGEKFSTAVNRLFAREIDVQGQKVQFKYLGVHYKIQYTSEHKVLFDDALTLFDVDLSEVNKNEITLKRQNKWFEKSKIKKLKGKWPEIDICIFNKDWIPYCEYTFVNDYNIKD